MALSVQDSHHLSKVLRLRPKQIVTVADGTGFWQKCSFVKDGILEPLEDPILDPYPKWEIKVAFALTKGNKAELVIQKLCELGVDSAVPFVSKNSIPKWDSKRASNALERFERIAREASMQSRRSRIMQIHKVSNFDELCEKGVVSGKMAMADLEGEPLTMSFPTVLIGPEGGWGIEETNSKLPKVGLSSQVLRAETAAITAGGLLCAIRDGVVRAINE